MPVCYRTLIPSSLNENKNPTSPTMAFIKYGLVDLYIYCLVRCTGALAKPQGGAVRGRDGVSQVQALPLPVRPVVQMPMDPRGDGAGRRDRAHHDAVPAAVQWLSLWSNFVINCNLLE